MRSRTRKLFSGVALVAGGALVFFEVRHSVALGRVESWFWLVVGVLVILLAAAEFVPRARSDDGSSDPTGPRD